MRSGEVSPQSLQGIPTPGWASLLLCLGHKQAWRSPQLVSNRAFCPVLTSSPSSCSKTISTTFISSSPRHSPSFIFQNQGRAVLKLEWTSDSPGEWVLNAGSQASSRFEAGPGKCMFHKLPHGWEQVVLNHTQRKPGLDGCPQATCKA